MHIASCLVFRGKAPGYEQLVAHISSRLHLVPRYRQKLENIPLGQGRPVWVDDPHFKLGYHIRHKALPRPGGELELSSLCGRVFSTQLDRSKPLWEFYLVDGLAGDRFALIAKTHHALVDGVSGMDLATVLFDLSADAPSETGHPEQWVPSPPPSRAQLLGEALLERATVPAEAARGMRALSRRPRRVIDWATRQAAGISSLAFAGSDPAPESPLNVPIGPHRRFTWVVEDLARLKAIKSSSGSTVNDVVLAAVAGGLGKFLRSRGYPTRDLEMRAMVPVSVRADSDHDLGNQVSAMWAPLPVGDPDALSRLSTISDAMEHVKHSGQAVGAHALTELAGFAPQTILSQAARLVPRQRFFNLVVTNVPGPQFPIWLLGRELLEIYPMVPLAQQQALGIAVVSYNGRICFGLNGDWDAMPDLDLLASDIRDSIAEMEEAIGPRRPKRSRRASPR